MLTPITLSQTATAPATGKGHQDARSATGTLTFYNGSFAAQTVYADTVFTGADGVQVVTDETAAIPPNNPPMDGQASTPAHAVNTGLTGNIQPLDINGTVSNSLYVKNPASFTGGRDERDFQTVAKSDIDVTASQLKDTLNQSTQGAAHVLDTKATELLISKAFKQPGAGYSLFGTIQVTVNHAIPTHNTPTLVLSIQGLWIYAISNKEQERIKRLIKGRTKQEALHILASLPGIEKASMNWDDNTKLPRDSRYIHLVLIAGI